MAGEVKYFFVLMLENRSFDHMLGYCGVPGVDGVARGMSNPDGTANVPVSDDAPDQPTSDPNHEYPDVQLQIFETRTPAAGAAATMKGFVKSADASVMRCFNPNTLPVLNQLAAEFTVCDRWFASMPGPTWPNRFFVHAGTSGGLDNSPSDPHSAIAVIDPDGWWGFEFANGTIYDRLHAAGLKWRVYHGDNFPQVLAIKGLAKAFARKDDTFRSIDPNGHGDRFAADVNNAAQPYDVAYTFIEPNYAILGGTPNSQHPKGTASAGEELIKYVYETLRNSPIWNESALIITYDEHGGFFDHKAPEAATPPGDPPRNHKQAEYPKDFKFDRFGVRVPAVIVSPRVGKGAVWHSTTDHTSILSTLRGIFPALGGALTARDAAAPSFLSVLTGPLRTDTPARLNDIWGPAKQSRRLTVHHPAPDDAAPPDPTLKGFSRIAADVARAMQVPAHTTLSAVVPHADIVAAARATGRLDVGSIFSAPTPPVVPRVDTAGQARDFIASVVAQLAARPTAGAKGGSDN